MSLFKKKKKHLESTTMDYGVRMFNVSKSGSANTEQFNTIRTNIEFSSADEQFKSIMLTSSMASDGKSTVAANLAVSFARQGKKTLLVDSDLRRPTFNATFSIVDPKGLTNFLTEKEMPANAVIYKTTVDNLSVMSSGPLPPNPSELIGSRKMAGLIKALEDNYDLVIYDAPPLLSVTDAQLISTRVDGTVLVVREGKTEKGALRQAVGLLNHVNAKIIGTIFNDVKGSSGSGYYGYYGKEDKK